jgi:hypothetical protein
MRERGHVVNAVALGVGIGVLLEPSMTVATLWSVLAVAVPVTLGALLPDVDTSFGDHRVHGHNLLVLGSVLAFPFVFGNLAWVWLGVLTHYVLDVFGSKRGIALFYPLSSEEFNLPIGVATSSKWADVMMLSVTAFEITCAAGILYLLPPEVLQTASQAIGL